jgi:hypothetical protein
MDHLNAKPDGILSSQSFIIIDIRKYGLFDPHGISGETFFSLWLRIDMSMPWGFCWSTLDEPWVFKPPMLRKMHTIAIEPTTT